MGHGWAGEVRSCLKFGAPEGRSYMPDPWPFCGRYRCITQQFFRKADGVIVMYDLTDKQSFLSVRRWLSSVEVSWRPS